MQQRFLALCIFLFLGFSALCQTGRISGIIYDEDNERIPNANISIYGGETSKSSTSDKNGKFSLELTSETEYRIIFSFVGKNEGEKRIFLNEGDDLNWKVTLYDDDNTIRGVEIIETVRSDEFLIKMDPSLNVRIPSVSGDISGIIITQGLGVSTNSELGSGYNVRGGNFDENLVYVNDIEVYRPFLVRAGQQEGLSFPNPNMISSMTFSAGGFEAKYGDKLSSVLDINYTRPSDFSGSVMASLLGASVHIQDQSKGGNFTYNTGLRYKSNAYILGSLDTQGDYNPNYIDLQTYMTWRPNDNGVWNFDILGNYSRNRYNFIPQTRETNIGNINEALRLTIFFDGQEQSQFETGFGAISANYVPSPKKLLKFQLSAFKTQESETYDILGQYFLDELERDLGSDDFAEVLRNVGVGSFLEHARNYLEATVLTFNHKGLSESHDGSQKLRWGLRFQNEQIDDQLREWVYLDSVGFSTPISPSDQIVLNDVVIAQNLVNSNRLMGHVQYEKEFKKENGSRLNTNLGVRANYWDFTNETVISPRGVLSYYPHKIKTHIDSVGKEHKTKKDVLYKLAAGYYYQPPFYRELRRFDGSINKNINAQKSIHLLAGMDYNFKAWDRKFKFIGEAYYKNLARIIPYEIDNVRIRYYADDTAKGYTAGTDFMVNGEFIKGVQSWVRLSLLQSKEDIDNDSYYDFLNSNGEVIVPGVTFNDQVTDSTLIEPGLIRRPTDQTFSFSLFFQDEMPRYPAWKVQLTGFYGTNLPYGPPGTSRADDVLKTPPYRRVDLGLSRELFYKRAQLAEKRASIIEDNSSIKTKKKDAFKSGFIALELFNLLGINNTINYTWIEAINGRQYAIPNFLTGRRVNLKLVLAF